MTTCSSIFVFFVLFVCVWNVAVLANSGSQSRSHSHSRSQRLPDITNLYKNMIKNPGCDNLPVDCTPSFDCKSLNIQNYAYVIPTDPNCGVYCNPADSYPVVNAAAINYYDPYLGLSPDFEYWSQGQPGNEGGMGCTKGYVYLSAFNVFQVIRGPQYGTGFFYGIASGNDRAEMYQFIKPYDYYPPKVVGLYGRAVLTFHYQLCCGNSLNYQVDIYRGGYFQENIGRNTYTSSDSQFSSIQWNYALEVFSDFFNGYYSEEPPLDMELRLSITLIQNPTGELTNFLLGVVDSVNFYFVTSFCPGYPPLIANSTYGSGCSGGYNEPGSCCTMVCNPGYHSVGTMKTCCLAFDVYLRGGGLYDNSYPSINGQCIFSTKSNSHSHSHHSHSHRSKSHSHRSKAFTKSRSSSHKSHSHKSKSKSYSHRSRSHESRSHHSKSRSLSLGTIDCVKNLLVNPSFASHERPCDPYAFNPLWADYLCQGYMYPFQLDCGGYINPYFDRNRDCTKGTIAGWTYNDFSCWSIVSHQAVNFNVQTNYHTSTGLLVFGASVDSDGSYLALQSWRRHVVLQPISQVVTFPKISSYASLISSGSMYYHFTGYYAVGYNSRVVIDVFQLNKNGSVLETTVCVNSNSTTSVPQMFGGTLNFYLDITTTVIRGHLNWVKFDCLSLLNANTTSLNITISGAGDIDTALSDDYNGFDFQYPNITCLGDQPFVNIDALSLTLCSGKCNAVNVTGATASANCMALAAQYGGYPNGTACNYTCDPMHTLVGAPITSICRGDGLPSAAVSPELIFSGGYCSTTKSESHSASHDSLSSSRKSHSHRSKSRSKSHKSHGAYTKSKSHKSRSASHASHSHRTRSHRSQSTTASEKSQSASIQSDSKSESHMSESSSESPLYCNDSPLVHATTGYCAGHFRTGYKCANYVVDSNAALTAYNLSNVVENMYTVASLKFTLNGSYPFLYTFIFQGLFLDCAFASGSITTAVNGFSIQRYIGGSGYEVNSFGSVFTGNAEEYSFSLLTTDNYFGQVRSLFYIVFYDMDNFIASYRELLVLPINSIDIECAFWGLRNGDGGGLWNYQCNILHTADCPNFQYENCFMLYTAATQLDPNFDFHPANSSDYIPILGTSLVHAESWVLLAVPFGHFSDVCGIIYTVCENGNWVQHNSAYYLPQTDSQSDSRSLSHESDSRSKSHGSMSHTASESHQSYVINRFLHDSHYPCSFEGLCQRNLYDIIEGHLPVAGFAFITDRTCIGESEKNNTLSVHVPLEYTNYFTLINLLAFPDAALVMLNYTVTTNCPQAIVTITNSDLDAYENFKVSPFPHSNGDFETSYYSLIVRNFDKLYGNNYTFFNTYSGAIEAGGQSLFIFIQRGAGSGDCYVNIGNVTIIYDFPVTCPVDDFIETQSLIPMQSQSMSGSGIVNVYESEIKTVCPYWGLCYVNLNLQQIFDAFIVLYNASATISQYFKNDVILDTQNLTCTTKYSGNTPQTEMLVFNPTSMQTLNLEGNNKLNVTSASYFRQYGQLNYPNSSRMLVNYTIASNCVRYQVVWVPFSVFLLISGKLTFQHDYLNLDAFFDLSHFSVITYTDAMYDFDYPELTVGFNESLANFTVPGTDLTFAEYATILGANALTFGVSMTGLQGCTLNVSNVNFLYDTVETCPAAPFSKSHSSSHKSESHSHSHKSKSHSESHKSLSHSHSHRSKGHSYSRKSKSHSKSHVSVSHRSKSHSRSHKSDSRSHSHKSKSRKSKSSSRSHASLSESRSLSQSKANPVACMHAHNHHH